MKTAQRVISADSHTMEPADLWTARVDRDLRDIAPRVLKNEDRPGYSFHVPGMAPSVVSGAWGAGKSGEELKKHLETAGYESARPSGWDPAERIKDQEIDGVEAEVLYGTLGMRLFPMRDDLGLPAARPSVPFSSVRPALGGGARSPTALVAAHRHRHGRRKPGRLHRRAHPLHAHDPRDPAIDLEPGARGRARAFSRADDRRRRMRDRLAPALDAAHGSRQLQVRRHDGHQAVDATE